MSDTAQHSIINTCVTSTTQRVDSCDDNDWSCLCDNSRAVLTCYDNCPEGKSTQQTSSILNHPLAPSLPTSLPI